MSLSSNNLLEAGSIDKKMGINGAFPYGLKLLWKMAF